MDDNQIEFQKKLEAGADKGGKIEKRDALDLEMHNEYQKMLKEQGNVAGIEKELRVQNAHGKIQII